MVESTVGAPGHPARWRRRLLVLVVVLAFAIVAAVVGYQVVPPFSDWVNGVLGSFGVGE
jgi:TRAP-type C4-dicarboxylate transport system permease small subunit